MGEVFEAFEGEGEVAASFVFGEGVDFVDDDCLDVAHVLSALLGGEHEEEGFGGCDEDMGWLLCQLGAFVRRGIAGAEADSNGLEVVAEVFSGLGDFFKGADQVLVHVVGQRAQGRDVDDVQVRFERSLQLSAEESVDEGEEGGEGFSGAGWGRDEDAFTSSDQGPALDLRVGRGGEAGGEPSLDDGVERS